jgi:hypothetical protein
MKVLELLESKVESAHIIIQKRINQIQKYQRDFNILAEVNGVEKTIAEIQEYLKVNDLVELILNRLAETDSKFFKLYQQYTIVKTKLEQTLHTGLSNE